MGSEYERKYRADAACQQAIAKSYPGRWEQIAMQTTYYDTPSGALSARHYTLRRRLENGVSVCTLKAPGKGKARGEWEVQSDEITAAISMLCKLGCPQDLPDLCREGLIPVCGAEFTRKALTLELPGCTAELALDRGRLFGGNKAQALCEVEIELKAGGQEALDAFAGSFAAKFGLQPEHRSKFARALALYKGE